MKQAIQSLLLASLLTSPLAMAGSDEIRVTVNAASSSAPLQIINTGSFLGMEILEPTCSNTMCTFKVYTKNSNDEYQYASVAIGKDAEHSCEFFFQEVYGF